MRPDSSNQQGNKLRVLVVDDSAAMRQLLTQILTADPGIEVVGGAEDPYVARDLIKRTNPDVLTLDLEMPRMDGLTFLKNLMRLRPMPVVMNASVSSESAASIMEALKLGAADFICKPGSLKSDEDYAEEVRSKVRGAAAVCINSLERISRSVDRPTPAPVATQTSDGEWNYPLIAIGASVGGTEAIKEILSRLPENSPPVVITQHIPPVFSLSFAQRMDRLSALAVQEAKDGQILRPGEAYIAPGARQMQVKQLGGDLRIRLHDGPEVCRHKPSVEVLFDSVNQACSGHVVAAILTGMGSDGSAALKRLRDNGARTLAQDEATSVVWGMAGRAVQMGAAERVVPINAMAGELLTVLKQAVAAH